MMPTIRGSRHPSGKFLLMWVAHFDIINAIYYSSIATLANINERLQLPCYYFLGGCQCNKRWLGPGSRVTLSPCIDKRASGWRWDESVSRLVSYLFFYLCLCWFLFYAQTYPILLSTQFYFIHRFENDFGLCQYSHDWARSGSSRCFLHWPSSLRHWAHHRYICFYVLSKIWLEISFIWFYQMTQVWIRPQFISRVEI